MKPQCAPYGTRTRVLALRGLRPRPLDERGLSHQERVRILANGRIPVKEQLIVLTSRPLPLQWTHRSPEYNQIKERSKPNASVEDSPIR